MDEAHRIIEMLVEADRDYQLWMARFRQAREEFALMGMDFTPMTSVHGGMKSVSESEESEGDDDNEDTGEQMVDPWQFNDNDEELMDIQTESDQAEEEVDEEEEEDARLVQAEVEEWEEIEQRHKKALDRMGEEFVGGDIALLEDHWSVQMARREREAYLRANQAVNAWEAASARRQHKDEMVKERERTKWAKDLREI